MTAPHASLVFSLLVLIFMFGITFIEQEAIGFGLFSTSTKHILQFPATASFS